jgi:hypothetical protein
LNTIQEQWDWFAKLVVPKDAPPIQQQEMRRAFYAGAEAMTRIQFAIADKDVSENAGIQILEGCHDELRRFALQMADGEA